MNVETIKPKYKMPPCISMFVNAAVDRTTSQIPFSNKHTVSWLCEIQTTEQHGLKRVVRKASSAVSLQLGSVEVKREVSSV